MLVCVALALTVLDLLCVLLAIHKLDTASRYNGEILGLVHIRWRGHVAGTKLVFVD